MSIRVKVKKTVNTSHQRVFTVSGIQMLTEDKLPKIYLDGTPRCVYLPEEQRALITTKANVTLDLRKGDTYTRRSLKRRLEAIQDCGNRLHHLNKAFDQIRQSWNGSHTFVI